MVENFQFPALSRNIAPIILARETARINYRMNRLSKFASLKLSVPRATKPLAGPDDTVPLYKTIESRVAEIATPYKNKLKFTGH